MTTHMAQARPLHAVGDTMANERWEPPIPLSARHQLPAFPVDALPAWLRDYVAAVATETQTPVDLPGCIGLAAISTAAGGRAEVEVRGRWREPVNIYTVVALPPGSRKSAVFSAIVRPLLDVERTLAEHVRPQIETARVERQIAQDRAAKAARQATTAEPGATPDAIVTATDAALAVDEITIPVEPRLVADDITPEKAASLMAEQGGRLAVLSAEGGIIATLAGRYSSAPNFEVFLKGHAGDLLRVDRHGRASEHIEHPALTLGLALQPDVLREITNIPGGRGKGLLGRILYALPEDLVGRRQIGPPSVPAGVAETYETNLAALTRSLADWTDSAVLTLTTEAGELVLALEAETEPKLAAGAEWSHARDWYGKWVGATARIAGLVHLATHHTDGWAHPITAETWQAAERISRYYAAHAYAAYDHMGADPTIEDARTLLAWICRNGEASFTIRDAYRANRATFTKVPDLQPALDTLETHGHIRRGPDPPGNRPGRKPSPAYFTHPTHRTA